MFAKIAKEIYRPIDENIKKLAELFPEVVRDGAVDFMALKAALGLEEDAGWEAANRYEIGWAGKSAARQLAHTDITGRTLKFMPACSKSAETTENVYIEGDNLEALKLLRNSYYNKIKMIYIDPPYNTGNDFVYRDKRTMSDTESAKAEGDIDDAGNRLILNQKSSGKYHANWLSMMYPRLKAAKDLLSDNGVICISIDDNEIANLRKICDEIFHEENFRNLIIVRRYDKNINRQFMESGLPSLNVGVEYVLVYTKSAATKLSPVFRPASEERSVYGYWKGFWNDADRPTMRYGLLGVTPETGQWKWKKEVADAAVKDYQEYMEKYSQAMSLEEYWEKSGKTKKFIRRNPDGKGKNMGVEHWVAPAEGILRNSNWSDILASKSLDIPFDNPKNPELIVELCKLANVENGDIVLDFFSGSGTTAQAVMMLNAEDGGRRNWILVQLPEEIDARKSKEAYDFLQSLHRPANICELGKERIRRAGESIRQGMKQDAASLDAGFKVFKVGNANIRWFSAALTSNLFDAAQALTDKDQLDFNPGFTDLDVVYEVMLRHRNIPLSTGIRQLNDIGQRTYLFAAAVVVCLEETITEQMIHKIASIEPIPAKIIFRDSAFGADISLKENTMLCLEAGMRNHSGRQRKAYRVEFI